jgi:peptidoglycan-associated lipoprotein
MNRLSLLFAIAFAGLFFAGCPKHIPQPEIDAAKSDMDALEAKKDCAPVAYAAARQLHDRAQALLKEERYEEAKAALLAARNQAAKADAECQKKREQEEAEARRKAAEAQAASRSAEAPPPPEPAGPAAMETVYFPFNASDLTEEARATLAQNAEYLARRPGSKVQIEGHCDNRGSTEYNLALGERRALSVKAYLVKLGVEPDRMEVISYGEERPADAGQSEEAFARNRRAEFKPLSQ